MTEQLMDTISNEEHERLISISEHAIALPLSPAAQAVFHAFNSKFDWIEDGVPGPQFNAIAAALRALAVRINGADAIRQDILDIADELDG